jgi:predicted aconitase with swiveling domain
MDNIILQGHKVVGGLAQGEALVCHEPITFLGGVNPFTGIVTEKGHALEGKCIADKILVYPTGKGSTGGSYRIYDMAKRGTAPKAIINLRAEPITAIGAIIGEIPMMDKLSEDPLKVIGTGDWVRVEASEGRVIIHKKGGGNEC